MLVRSQNTNVLIWLLMGNRTRRFLSIYSLNENSQLIQSANYSIFNTPVGGIRRSVTVLNASGPEAITLQSEGYGKAPLSAGSSSQLWGPACLQPSTIFFKKKKTCSLKWWLSPKPQNLPPAISSSSLWVETPSQLHGKCVSLLFMAMNQQPFGTGCWLTAVETHWLHKENGFHLCLMKGSGGRRVVVMGWKVKENCPDPLLI